MAKYFVHEGMQFQTISVSATRFNGPLNATYECVTLESIADALGTEVVAGADTTARSTALQAFFAEDPTPPLTDRYQILARELVNQKASIDPDDTPGAGADSTTTAHIHGLSHQYILPPGLSDGMTVVPASNSDIGSSRDRISVKALEVRHDNIKKHETTTEAWDAWVAYIISNQSTAEQSLAEQGYLLNSGSTTTN